MAKLAGMNTRFQRGAMEITLDLFKGLSLILSAVTPQSLLKYGNYIRPV